MQIQIGARTDVGRMRKNNEDNFKVVPERNLFVVSDGMGGEAHGEVASEMAVEGIAEHFLNHQPGSSVAPSDVSESSGRLVGAVRAANRSIFELASRESTHRGMGATVVAAFIEGQRLSLAHVGDSRAYLFRTGDLQQLTADHSLVAEQVRRGILTQQQADESDMASVLTRAMGIDADVEVDIDEHLLLPGDDLLMCSDGLVRMVTDPEIASTLLTWRDPQQAVDRLVELANENGGADNITIVLVRLAESRQGLLRRIWRWLTSPVDSTSPDTR